MPVHPEQRQLLAQFLGVAVVGVDVDRALEQERLIQAVQLALKRLRGTLGGGHLVTSSRLAGLPDLQHRLLE
ncbi:MAG TPA: hypothetical protein PLH72_18225 [Vicinamibacterales bacterium]|nr:hypothetical protein [Vicinamibacterales bacterium]